MNEPWTLLVVVLLCSVCVVALLIVLHAFFAVHIQRSSRAAAQAAGRSFLIGAVNMLFFGALAAVLAGTNVPLLQVIGVVIAAVMVVAIAIGLAGMVQLAGERMMPSSSPLRRTSWSAVLLVAACLTPYVGWFLFLPYLVFRGVGGWILGWVRERRGVPSDA